MRKQNTNGRDGTKILSSPFKEAEHSGTPTYSSIYVRSLTLINKFGETKESDDHTHHTQTNKSNVFSFLHFFFAVSLIRFVNALKDRALSVKDLNPVEPQDTCQNLETLFTQEYTRLSRKYHGQLKILTYLIINLFKKDILVQIFWQLLYALSRILASYFFFLLLMKIRDRTHPAQEGFYPAIGLFLNFILGVYSTHHMNFNSSYVLNKLRAGFLGMLFRKMSKLSHHAVHITSLGKIITMMGNDLNNLDRVHFVVSLFLAPFILLGGYALLFKFWGCSCLVGLAYVLIIWIIQRVIAGRTFPLRVSRTQDCNKRINTIIEGIEGIRVIKTETWEFPFIDMIKQIRNMEVKKIKKFNFLECISRALVSSSNWIAGFLIYYVHTYSDKNINPPLVFPTIYLLTFLRQLCLFYTFQGLAFIEEMRSLFTRIISIMELSEIESNIDPLPPRKPENSIEFEDFSAYWINQDIQHDVLVSEVPLEDEKGQINTKIYKPTITNFNLHIEKGNLCALIGKIGAGKSALLLSITGEIAKSTRKIRYQGNYAYVAQEPVLFFGSIRENIILGQPYDNDFFWEVVEGCGLLEDVRNFPMKEMTEIGEKGAILSSSQKTLVVLARAIYLRADIYLLDDPLSGLDPKLAKQVFKSAIQGLLKHKTVLLVTHDLNLAKYANKIVILDNGKLQAHGTYEELVQDASHLELVAELRKVTKYDYTVTMQRHSQRFASEVYQPKAGLEKVVKKSGDPRFLTLPPR